MSSLFDQERPFWRFLNRASDIVIINVITVLLCLPIVTAGAAYTALYYTTVKTVKKGRGYLLKNYFHSFSENFFQATVSWMFLLTLFVSSLYLAYVNYKPAVSGGMPQFIFWISFLVCFMLFCTVMYCFPVLSRFVFNTKTLISFSYIIAVRYFTYTLGLVVLAGLFILVGYFIPPLIFICLPATFVYMASGMIEKIFRVYMRKFEEDLVNTGSDDDENGNTEKIEDSEDSTDVEDEPRKDQWYYE